MKLILSRKGFDSENGGYPSPILPDGTLLSIPIPIAYNSDKYKPIKYEDLQIPKSIINYFSNNNVQIETYKDLLNQILSNYPILYKKSYYSIESPLYCHVDPDLNINILKRENSREWRPAFGQNSAAQGHLKNQGVGPNDLFLFFGWFRHTIIEDSKLHYNCSKPDKHIIFGYLQIDCVLSNEKDINEHAWIKTHPHSYGGLLKSKNNAIYITKERLSWDNKYAGAGYFKYQENLVLTEIDPKINPKRNLTIWKYNFIPPGTKITYHKDKSWVKEKNYFQAAGKGQEFVISKCPKCVKELKFEIK